MLVILLSMTVKEDKYFFSKLTDTWWSSGSIPAIFRWSKYHLIEIEEDVESCQYINCSFDKFKSGHHEKPVSDDRRNVRSIIKEVFLSHYNLAVKILSEIELDDGEFYIRKHGMTWYEMIYFSKDEKEQRQIKIDFEDNIQLFNVLISSKRGYKGRPQYRKTAMAISKEKFMLFLNCTLQFLYDSDSYYIFMEDYKRKFLQILDEDSKFEGFILSADKSFEKILNQLLLRKDSIKKG